MTVTLVIPFYNEGEALGRAVRQSLELRERLECPLEIIFVDDGSTDGAAKGLDGLDITLLTMPHNTGKGGAVRYGVLSSGGDLVIYTDCDLAYGLDIVPDAIAHLQRSKAALLCGSRRLSEEGYSAYPTLRRIASHGFSLFVRMALGLTASDTQCGFKCLKGDVARRLFANVKTDGYSFDLELLARARKSGDRLTEFPVSVINHGSSKVNLIRDTFKMIGEVLKIRRLVK